MFCYFLKKSLAPKIKAEKLPTGFCLRRKFSTAITYLQWEVL